MIRHLVVIALFIAAIPQSGRTAGTDNSTPPPGNIKTAVDDAPSFFQGTWAGSWQGYLSASGDQGITITIEKGKTEGMFTVTYSWEGYSTPRRTFPSGSLKTRGTQSGDSFTFKWKNKEGREFEVVMLKEEQDKVKARLDRLGPAERGERPSSDGHLKRK